MEIENNYTTQASIGLSPQQIDSLEAAIETQSDFSLVLKDLAAGSIAGIANVISGHPFDTVKVRMQMSDTKLSTCIKSIWNKEGLKSFYKGVYSPLYSVPIINAMVFGAYETSKRFLGSDNETAMTLSQGMIAGSFAGFINCIAVTPVELIKCRQQMEGMGMMSKNSTTWELTRRIFKTNGISGLYKGNLITILREMPAYAAQFATYEIVKDQLTSKFGQSNVINFIAGATAGFSCWLCSYPQDVIKTKLQLDIGGPIRQYKSAKYLPDGGIISCTRDIYRKEGLSGFWRGFSACTMRAMIANAFTFVVYEEAKKLFV